MNDVNANLIDFMDIDHDERERIKKSSDLKECRKCKTKKPKTAFSYHSHYKDNLNSYCRVCKRTENKLVKNLRKTAPPKPAVCECCGGVPSEFNPPRKWCLDHNHQTGKFRGWLCAVCNLSIGQLGDTVEGLMRGIDYLKKTGG
jgi:hypothetical protein